MIDIHVGVWAYQIAFSVNNETVQDRAPVTIYANWKSYVAYRTTWSPMTLSNLECNLSYFKLFLSKYMLPRCAFQPVAIQSRL